MFLGHKKGKPDQLYAIKAMKKVDMINKNLKDQGELTLSLTEEGISHMLLSVFMPPTSKKLRGHIGLGLSVRLSVCLSVTLFGSSETQEPLMLES